MADPRNETRKRTHPSVAEQFKHITSRLGKTPDEPAFNSRNEGSAQIRQTVESLKKKIMHMFGRK